LTCTNILIAVIKTIHVSVPSLPIHTIYECTQKSAQSSAILSISTSCNLRIAVQILWPQHLHRGSKWHVRKSHIHELAIRPDMDENPRPDVKPEILKCH
jgi:hypothetical protein